jgi:alpha-L-fucosidase
MEYANFTRFERKIPSWFTDAKFGIFIHWGAYSVPAWAEPTGELGTIDDKEWFKHNPYAEWYFNTIRIEGSPAQLHHKEAFGGCDYDDLLDMWKPVKFNPDDWAQLFKRAGAQYIIPTTKHHDGITLWDAPGTGTRNTVARGPKQDLIKAIGDAVRKQGIKFGVYYSGGLDWSISQLPPISDEADVRGLRPVDAAYAMYCYEHIIDLIDKYKPDVLWDDIEYPDFAKREGEYSLAAIFDHYYESVPEGVVNDRWGVPFQDYKTSEYQHMLDNEGQGPWENCRGIGYSFGYNQIETQQHYMSINQALHHLCDIVSRGGNLLLNIGPTAEGEIPAFQIKVLEGVGAWLSTNGDAIYGTEEAAEVKGADATWIRWTSKGAKRFAIIDGVGEVTISAPESIDESSAQILGGGAISISRSGDLLSLTIPKPTVDGPTVISFNKK